MPFIIKFHINLHQYLNSMTIKKMILIIKINYNEVSLNMKQIFLCAYSKHLANSGLQPYSEIVLKRYVRKIFSSTNVTAFINGHSIILV